jgi:hypothetical protein
MFSKDTPLPSGPNPAKSAKALAAVNELEFKLLQAKKSISDDHGDELENSDGAFVTFNNEESYERCLRAYRQHSGWFARIFNPMPSHLKFRRRKPPIVVPAPDPSEVIWENLDSSRGCCWGIWVARVLARRRGCLQNFTRV